MALLLVVILFGLSLVVKALLWVALILLVLRLVGSRYDRAEAAGITG